MSNERENEGAIEVPAGVAIESLTPLRLQDGDVLVVHLQDRVHVSQAAYERLVASFEEKLARAGLQVPVILAEGVSTFSILRRDEGNAPD